MDKSDGRHMKKDLVVSVKWFYVVSDDDDNIDEKLWFWKPPVTTFHGEV